MGACCCCFCPVSYNEARQVEDKYYPEYFAKMSMQSGKIIAITGCTSGTGFQCALASAKKGATVIMLNRPSKRALEAEQALRKQCPSATIDSIECDLGSLESTRAAAGTVKGKYTASGIDVLCCNAGVMACADEATVDGFDVQMQTNHLSHFLLQYELFDLLKIAANMRGEARIVNHSSVARFGSALEERYLGRNGGDLGGNSSSMLCGGARWKRYQQSKLAQPVFTWALHQRISQSGKNLPNIKVLCAAPGYAATQLQVSAFKNGGFVGCFDVWTTRFAQSVSDGTMPLLHCCFDAVPSSGELWEPINFGHMAGPVGVTPPNKKERDEESLKMLWSASERACGVTWDL